MEFTVKMHVEIEKIVISIFIITYLRKRGMLLF